MNILNKLIPNSATLIAIGAFGALSSLSNAAITLNFANPFSSPSDFTAADINIPTSIGTGVGQSVSAGAASTADFNNLSFSSASITTSTGTTTLLVTSTGTATSAFQTNNGHVDGDTLLDGNVFNNNTLGLNVSGLASLDAGSVVTVTTYGIGDNIGQDTTITGTFGTDIQSGDTVFNTSATNDRNDPTGTSPFVQFQYTADGVTDQIQIDVTGGPGGQNRSHINAFSVSVVIPEPSSLMLLGVSGGFLLTRRRRA